MAQEFVVNIIIIGNNMKQITITVPDNCELKQDGNTYTIVEKEKKLNYDDVARKLFSIHYCYINADGSILNTQTANPDYIKDATNCTSIKQAEKLLAINKLINVAKYLNDGWQSDWNTIEKKWYIYFNNTYKTIESVYETKTQNCTIYFKSEKLAQQAIEILGEETIKLALCTDY